MTRKKLTRLMVVAMSTVLVVGFSACGKKTEPTNVVEEETTLLATQPETIPEVTTEAGKIYETHPDGQLVLTEDGKPIEIPTETETETETESESQTEEVVIQTEPEIVTVKYEPQTEEQTEEQTQATGGYISNEEMRPKAWSCIPELNVDKNCGPGVECPYPLGTLTTRNLYSQDGTYTIYEGIYTSTTMDYNRNQYPTSFKVGTYSCGDVWFHYKE